ncbi:hypothetical protein HanXRQr2_Chr15g0698331 [Helianthus annuus]|uniref:Uncharacterized protein n=2 Tax=Helianthus annuus TaxID=4232 RepID=A0A9K3H4Z6_HELAN|nr:hypothetical protein HanXRQr2_Chr15g0698331 [Helianthus annuus]
MRWKLLLLFFEVKTSKMVLYKRGSLSNPRSLISSFATRRLLLLRSIPTESLSGKASTNIICKLFHRRFVFAFAASIEPVAFAETSPKFHLPTPPVIIIVIHRWVCVVVTSR